MHDVSTCMYSTCICKYEVQYTCLSIKCHHTVTVITLVQYSIVITASLLWCSIDKYTLNYCSVEMKLLSNYCTI